MTAAAVLSLASRHRRQHGHLLLVNSLLHRSLPVQEPERLASVSTNRSSGRQQYSYATFEQIRERRDIFDGALAYTDCCGTAILDANGEAQAVDRQFVSGDFFSTLGTARFADEC